MLTVEFGRFTRVLKLVDGPDTIEGKGRATFLPTVGAMTDADAKGLAANGNLYLPAKAFARKYRHVCSQPVLHTAPVLHNCSMMMTP